MRIDSNQSIGKTGGSGASKVKWILLFLIVIVGLILPASADVGTLELLRSRSDGVSYAVNTYSYGTETHILMSAGGSIRDYNITGTDFYTLDVTNLDLPTYSNLTSVIRDIVIDNTTQKAYIIAEEHIGVYSFANKSFDSIISNPTTTAYRSGALSGNYLYATTFGKGVHVIYTPSMAVVDSSIWTTTNWVSSNISGTKLYLGRYGGGIIDVLDITDPVHPSNLTTWTAPDTTVAIYDLKSNGDALYATTQGFGWYIINTSVIPYTNTYVSGSITVLGRGGAQKIDIINSSALVVSRRYSSYNLYNISNPTTPTLVSTNTTSLGYTEQIKYNNGSIFITSSTIGMYIFNESSALLYQSDNIPIMGEAYSIINRGTELYIGSRNTWFTIANKSDLKPVSNTQFSSSRMSQMIFSNNTIYSSNWNNAGIRSIFLNASNRSVDNTFDSKPIDGANAWDGMLKVDNYIYTQVIVSYWKVLGIYQTDGTDGNATLVNWIWTNNSTTLPSGQIKNIVQYNNTTILFPSSGDGVVTSGNMMAYDITNRTNPVLIKTIYGNFGSFDYNQTTQQGFIVENGNTVQAINMSGLERTILGNLSRAGQNSPAGFCRIGDVLYTGGTTSIDAINVTYLNGMVLINRFVPYYSANAAGVDISCDSTNNTIYAADSWGTYAFNHSNVAVTTPPTEGVDIYDADIRGGGSANTNYGSATTLQLYNGAWRQNGVMHIGTQDVPADSTINEVILNIRYNGWDIANPAGGTIQFFMMWYNRSDFAELNVTWNNWTVNSPWTTAGGDYDNSNSVNLTIPAAAGFVQLNITDYYRAAYNNGSNLGLVLFYYNTTGRPKFDSVQGTSAYRPYINRNYTSSSDTTPPESVTSLINTTYEQTYITWTWQDPADTDFDHEVIFAV